MIQIELNGKTRLITIEEFLERDLQDLIADDIGFDDDDPIFDFRPKDNLSSEELDSPQN